MGREIKGDVFLKNMIYWSSKTTDECIEMSTVDGKLDAEQAMVNILERDFAIDFNKQVIKEIRNDKQ